VPHESPLGSVILVRHGETAWSKSGQHTSITDLPLTPEGEEAAKKLREVLAGKNFRLVLSSPRQRARHTCQLAGLADRMEVTDDLAEWFYGDYEGLTTPQIREKAPGWTVFSQPCPGGETAEQVGARLDRVIARIRQAGGTSVVFAHGHCLRVFAARWLELPPVEGKHFVLKTATLSELGYERETPVVHTWNAQVG
jgi:probable phosphoglycerate mutase